MKCQICRKRKATIRVDDELYGSIVVCGKCRREFIPTPAEQKDDEDQEERRAERSAEFASAGDYW